MSENKGGRRPGTGQDQLNANKALKNMTEIVKRINNDSLDGYDVLIKLMKDENTTVSTRRGIAKDLIEWQMQFAADAPNHLSKPTNRHEEKKREIADTARKVVSFSK